MSDGGTEMGDRQDPHPDDDFQAMVEQTASASPEGEDDLVRRIRNGDRVALDQLIDANLSVVVKIAGRFRHRGLSDRDLIAEGTMGLIRAARHIDMAPESRFIEVAVWWIQRAIQTAIIEQIGAQEFIRPCGCTPFESGYQADRGPTSAT